MVEFFQGLFGVYRTPKGKPSSFWGLNLKHPPCASSHACMSTGSIARRISRWRWMRRERPGPRRRVSFWCLSGPMSQCARGESAAEPPSPDDAPSVEGEHFETGSMGRFSGFRMPPARKVCRMPLPPATGPPRRPKKGWKVGFLQKRGPIPIESKMVLQFRVGLSSSPSFARGSHKETKHLGVFELIWQWVKNMYQNGTLVNGSKEYNLRNPSCLLLSHTHLWDPRSKGLESRIFHGCASLNLISTIWTWTGSHCDPSQK